MLFDLDGTLINSVDHIVDCWQHTVRTCLGRVISRDEVLPTLGRTLFDCFEEIAPGRSDELYAAYRSRQEVTHDTDITLVHGARETLESLRAAGLPLGVVTAKGVPAATRGLNLFDLAPYFSAVITHEQTTHHKPHPDPVLAGCARLGVRPSDVLYVGDALVDVEAGKAAGTLTVAVTWGAGSLKGLIASGPDYIFDSMSDLLSLFRIDELTTGGAGVRQVSG